MTVETKIGFIKEAPSLNVCGFNVYHKNRLIRVCSANAYFSCYHVYLSLSTHTHTHTHIALAVTMLFGTAYLP